DHDSTNLASRIFDHPVALFFGGLWLYTTFAPIATRIGYKRHARRLWGVAAILLVQQAHF
ncbi:uncharacterized protein F5147DRAFT_552200, partial [Suillus discolor]